jgi:hypothetical protein
VEGVTGGDGLATLSVPPGCRLRLAIDACGAGDGRYEAGGTTGSGVDGGVNGSVNGSVDGVERPEVGPGETAAARVVPTSAARQFYGFSLERVVDVHVRCVDAASGRGVGGATVAAYDVTARVARADDADAAAAAAAAAAIAGPAAGVGWPAEDVGRSAATVSATGGWPDMEAGHTHRALTTTAPPGDHQDQDHQDTHAYDAHAHTQRTVPRRELGMPPGGQAADAKRQARALGDAASRVGVEGLVAVRVCETGADGRLKVRGGKEDLLTTYTTYYKTLLHRAGVPYHQ